MSVQQCTLVDVRDPGDHAKWITVTPQTQFTDNDSVSHSAAVTFNYSSDALPSTAKVPRSDAAGNNPTPVLYTIRRVLGAGGQGNQTWTNVLLNSSTVNLNDLTQVPGITTVVNVVTQVDGVNPDAEGHVTTGSPAAIAAEITRATTAEAANATAITAEASTRATADTANANAITSEATARAAAVTSEASTRATADTANANAVTAEASTRATADTANANAITSEASTRATADTANASAITAETTRATAAETTNATAIATEATNRTAADLLKADKPIGDDGKVLAWDDSTQGFVDATGKYVDPTEYLIDQANRSAFDLAAAHQDAVAGDNVILGLIGGATQWAPDTQYAANTLVGYGGFPVFKANPPSGNVLENLPPFGLGDGSASDRQLLLQRRVGFGAAATGGLNYATITVTTDADYDPVTTSPVVGSLRWAIEVQARGAGGGWIIFDKTYNLVSSMPTYRVQLKNHLCLLTSNITVDGRGADVQVSGGDGTFAWGGQPGLPVASTATAYSSSTAYSGSFVGPKLVTSVPTDTGSTYACVDNTALTQAQDGGLTPITSPRWRKVATVVANGTVFYEQSASVVSASDGKTYRLVKPIGGYTLVGTSSTVKRSVTACTVDPSSDRHDLNAATGHWEPVGSLGWCLCIGAMVDTPGSIDARFSFTDPAGCNGIPPKNIIVEKIAKVDNWGGESNDTGSHRACQIQYFAKDVWIDRCFVTNPCQWNDGLWDVRGPSTNISFTWTHFKQHHKALLNSGVGTATSPPLNVVSQVNPDLVSTYGSTAAGYAMWNDSANTVLRINKLDKNSHVIDWSSVPFPANAELEHGQTNPEYVLVTAVDHSNSGYDLLTVQTRLGAKKHLAAADATGALYTTTPVNPNPATGGATLSKKTQIYLQAHFLPGLTDDYPVFTDSFGIAWVDLRVTYANCWMEQLADRGPHADNENCVVHLLNNYVSDWGLYYDPLIDPSNTTLSVTFPCIPSGLAPVSGSAVQTSNGARLIDEGVSFEHATGATGGSKKMFNTTSGTGYLKTLDRLDVPGDSTADADVAGGDFTIPYSYTAKASSTVKAPVKQAAGPVALWLYDHAASITIADGSVVTAKLADGSVTTAKLAANAVTSAKVDSTVATTSGTQTLSNKRRTRRVVTVTQAATPTVNTDNTDLAKITGLAQAITSMTTNLTGTPVSGDTLEFHITDNGTARAITWGASFASTTVALPTTTVISTKLRVGFEWDTDLTAWACVAVA